MAEVFVTFTESMLSNEGERYLARICGGETDDGRWQGWVEFEAADGSATVRTPRETTQPNRTDLAYWATGLTAVYLEGALERALRPDPPVTDIAAVTPAFDEPRPPRGAESGSSEAVLNPFSVYRKGEAHLRQQLAALASWHLVNILRVYELSAQPASALERMSADELIELIVAGVRHDTPVKS